MAALEIAQGPNSSPLGPLIDYYLQGFRGLLARAAAYDIAQDGLASGLTDDQIADLTAEIFTRIPPGVLISPESYGDIIEEIRGELLRLDGELFLVGNGQFIPVSEYDGDNGDNIPGDGYVYDYTQDISRDHQDWENDRSDNNVNDGPLDDSPRPQPNPRRPIILDLDGSGISVTELSQSTHFVDGGDGLEHRTAWAGAGDGVLFFDADGSGDISEQREYVFTEWDGAAGSKLEAQCV